MLFSEPSTRDDEPDPQREDEEVRQERWTEFQGWLAPRLRSEGFADFLRYVASVQEFGGEHGGGQISDFAEDFGWPGVLTAIAQAMKDEQALTVECERRR